MAIRYPDATRTAAISPVNDLLNAGTGPGEIRLYSGSQPASAESAATGTLLATFTLNDPAGTVAAGVLTLDVDPGISTTAVATGTAGWFRATDSAGTTVFDGSAGTSGADLILNTTAISSGGTVSITSGTLTQSAG